MFEAYHFHFCGPLKSLNLSLIIAFQQFRIGVRKGLRNIFKGFELFEVRLHGSRCHWNLNLDVTSQINNDFCSDNLQSNNYSTSQGKLRKEYNFILTTKPFNPCSYTFWVTIISHQTIHFRCLKMTFSLCIVKHCLSPFYGLTATGEEQGRYGCGGGM